MNDVLRFIIYDDKNNVLLTKESGLGITQEDDGSYVILIDADELNSQTFPGNRYRYAVRITEGDTARRYPLQQGPLTLKDLPF